MTEFRLLGPVEGVDGRGPLDLGPPQRRAVLAALAVDVGRPVAVETVVDRVWDDAPDGARRAVYVHLTHLRRVFANDDERDTPTLIRRSGGYVLDARPESVDVHRFTEAVRVASALPAGDPERAEMLRCALTLWRGTPLSGVPGAWAERTRQRWRQLRIDALIGWAETELEQGRPHEILAPLQEAMAQDAVVEPLVALIMGALDESGRGTEAVRYFAAVRRQLVDELGVEPGPDLRELHCAILIRNADGGGPARPSAQSGQSTTAGPPSAAKPAPVSRPPVPRPSVPEPAPVSKLSGRRMLVVLDNASNVEQVRPLLPGAGSCAVLVTSRDSLSALVAQYGARRVSLDALPPGCAVALLRALIGWRVDEEPAAAGLIASRCAYLPLTLRVAAELAAQRPDTCLATLAEELADERERLDLLDTVGDERTAVRAVFSWSYHNLAPAAARLFELIGRHATESIEAKMTASIEARVTASIEGMITASIDGLDTSSLDTSSLDVGAIDVGNAAELAGIAVGDARRLLHALAGKHLVRMIATDRFRMPDLLRVYAAERAETTPR